VEGSASSLDAGAARLLMAEIGDELLSSGVRFEIAVYGGAALLFHYDGRPSTRDIDFVGISSDPDDRVAAAADKIGEKHGLAAGWFNDAVSMFVGKDPDLRMFGDFPPHGSSGLRVFLASPEYILAMKLFSMRSSMVSHDVLDIWNLADVCGVADPEAAISFVSKFFPGTVVTERTRAILDDLFEDKRNLKHYDPMMGW
jgi:hypothetical protein